MSDPDHSVHTAALFRAAGLARGGMCHAILTFLAASSVLLLGATSALSEVACRPLLSVQDVREVRPPDSTAEPWTWHATIAADVRYCATKSGVFEIDFVRSKENSPDLQFTERFNWRPSQFHVSIELMSDESILAQRIGFIAPCVCREPSER